MSEIWVQLTEATHGNYCKVGVLENTYIQNWLWNRNRNWLTGKSYSQPIILLRFADLKFKLKKLCVFENSGPGVTIELQVQVLTLFTNMGLAIIRFD